MDTQSQNYWSADTNHPPESGPEPTAPIPQTDATAQRPAFMQAVSWEASEFVHRDKNSSWFIGTIVVGALFALFALFVLKEMLFTIVIVVMTATVLFLAARPPRILRYQLTEGGLRINETHYAYHEFRGFGVVMDGGIHYITLLPIKRFMPAIDLYFPQENGETIVDLLGAHIPMQTVTPDIIDRLAQYLRL